MFQLQALDVEEKILALQNHAHVRGFELTPKVAGYLIKHCPCDMKVLLDYLRQLDSASLASQRKLTVAFVRDFLQTIQQKNNAQAA